MSKVNKKHKQRIVIKPEVEEALRKDPKVRKRLNDMRYRLNRSLRDKEGGLGIVPVEDFDEYIRQRELDILLLYCHDPEDVTILSKNYFPYLGLLIDEVEVNGMAYKRLNNGNEMLNSNMYKYNVEQNWKVKVEERVLELFEEYLEAFRRKGRLVNMAGFAAFCGVGSLTLLEMLDRNPEARDYINTILEDELIQSATFGKNPQWHIHYANNRLGYKSEKSMIHDNSGIRDIEGKTTEELMAELKQIRSQLSMEATDLEPLEIEPVEIEPIEEDSHGEKEEGSRVQVADRKVPRGDTTVRQEESESGDSGDYWDSGGADDF